MTLYTLHLTCMKYCFTRCLGDDRVVEDIGMESIVMAVTMRGKINQICIKFAFYVPKL